MQSLHDIFRIWDSTAELAEAIGALPDTVYRWTVNERIPQDSWDAVIAAASRKGKRLTYADFMRANKPMKVRGRKPSHKIQSGSVRLAG